MDKQKQASTASTGTTPKASETKSVKEASTAKTPSPAGEKSQGHPLVFLLGAAAVAFGAALVVLPVVAREQAGIVNALAKHGVTGTPVALTGLVLCVLAIVGRKKPDTTASRQSADQGLLLEQIACDLALMRGGMQELRVEYVYLKDQIQKAIAQRDLQEAQAKEHDAAAAMFRLAASMDQLTGRIETRMIAQDNALAGQFTTLHGEIGELRSHVGDLRARIEEGIQTASTADSGNGYHVSDERQIEIEEGYRPHADDFEVAVELEQIEEQGLGLLDEFDDHGQIRREKHSPSMRPGRRATDLEAQAGLLPSRNLPAPRSVDEKLAALRELMSDPTVRQALEAARRV